jgi:hypothetical protein
MHLFRLTNKLLSSGILDGLYPDNGDFPRRYTSASPLSGWFDAVSCPSTGHGIGQKENSEEALLERNYRHVELYLIECKGI